MKGSGSPKQSARHAQLLSTLLRAWQESIPTEEWRRLDQGVLRADCAALLEFGGRRRPTQTLLRVSCAPATGKTAYSLVRQGDSTTETALPTRLSAIPCRAVSAWMLLIPGITS